MPALIDTHTFLWLTGDTSRLSPTARSFMEDKSNQLLLNIASGWEIAVKLSIGKLKVALPLDELLTAAAARAVVQLTPITNAHVIAVSRLPFHHRDPFDRLMAAHCLTEGLPIVSQDAVFDTYGVRRIW